MGYEYRDPSREDDPTALPNVEVWLAGIGECQECGAQWPLHGDEHPTVCASDDCDATADTAVQRNGAGWFYAFGFPGCVHDSEPVGPYASRREALEAAREE